MIRLTENAVAVFKTALSLGAAKVGASWSRRAAAPD
ncbi:hypothetical protein X755_32590 [Mesorhizobium sp. LNJC405B00]|nr:hypothetical protein X755_32590 [Mesorhizobium sp. LNJC405B00]